MRERINVVEEGKKKEGREDSRSIRYFSSDIQQRFIQLNLTHASHGTPCDVCKWPVTNDLVIPVALLLLRRTFLLSGILCDPVCAALLFERAPEFSSFVRYIPVHPSAGVRSSVSHYGSEQTAPERVTVSHGGGSFVSGEHSISDASVFADSRIFHFRPPPNV